MRVAGFQMPVTADVDANSERIVDAIDWAARQGAEILLTPEGSVSGYTHRFAIEPVRRAVDAIARHARERELGLALGTCYVEEDGNCYNQIRFWRPDGQYLGFHSKTLCCGSVREPVGGEVNHFAVAPLRTFPWAHGRRIGGLICNDMWANPQCTPMPDPHLSQKLSELRAEVIFHAVNGGRDGSEWSRVAWQYHESNLRLRARAGGVWIVTVDSATPEHLPCSAPSGVVEPSGQFVCRTDPIGAQRFIYDLDLTLCP